MSDVKNMKVKFELALGDKPGDTGAFNLSGVFTQGKESTDKGTFAVHVVQLDGVKGPTSIVQYPIDEKNLLEITLVKGLVRGVYPVAPAGEFKPLPISKDSDLKIGMKNNIFKHGEPYQSALIGGNDTRSGGIKMIDFIAADLQQVKGASITVQIQFKPDSQRRGTLIFRTAKANQLLLHNACAADVLEVPYWGLHFDEVPLECN